MNLAIRHEPTSDDQFSGAAPSAGILDARLIGGFPAAVTIADLERDRVIAESDLATSLLGCNSPRIGERFSRRWTARRDFDTFLARFRASGRLDGAEVRLQRNDGVQFWCSASARLIDIEDRPHILLHMLDLSEQIAARAEISRQRDALHDAERLSALGQLLGGISHELNNPLSILTGQALMLRDKATDEATAKRADRILNAAERCSRIVRSFLDLARGKPSALVSTDLNEIVVEATEATIGTLRSAGIEAVLDLPRGIPRVTVDPDQIRQVVINLIVNAGHALAGQPEPRRVTILTRKNAASGGVILKVSDTGPGVPAEISSRIFDPLFTTKGPDGGTGLGLALCRQIMEAHAGRIRLDATSARGSSFVLTFGHPDGRSLPAPTLRRDCRDRSCLSILLLDDRPRMGTAMADLLSGEGHGVDLVESAYVGVEMLRRARYDAIFCKAGFGNLGGAAVLRAINEARPGSAASVIFLVGAEADGATLDALDQLERPYLEEPFDHRDILDILELITLRRAA